MTDDTEPLDELWTTVTGRLDELGTPVFPALPDMPDEPLVARWPDDDWRAFLDVAARAGAPLLYAECDRVDERSIEVLTAALSRRAGQDEGPHRADDDDDDDGDDEEDVGVDGDGGDGPDDDRDRVRTWQAAVDAGTARLGQVGRVDLAFVLGGVVHEWSRCADWYAEFTGAVMDAGLASLDEAGDGAGRLSRYRARWEVAEQGRQLLADLQPVVEDWACQLTASTVFVGGTSQEKRHLAAGEVLPELGEWLALSDTEEDPLSWARRHAASNAVWQAEQALPTVRGQRCAALRDREQQVAAAVAADPEFRMLRTKPERKRHVKAVVTAELGFPSPEPTDRILALAERAAASSAPSALPFG